MVSFFLSLLSPHALKHASLIFQNLHPVIMCVLLSASNPLDLHRFRKPSLQCLQQGY